MVGLKRMSREVSVCCSMSGRARPSGFVLPEEATGLSIELAHLNLSHHPKDQKARETVSASASSRSPGAVPVSRANLLTNCHRLKKSGSKLIALHLLLARELGERFLHCSQPGDRYPRGLAHGSLRVLHRAAP